MDNGKEINLAYAVKAKTITSGLKYSLATGNWGQANTAGVRAGVSQVIIVMSHLQMNILIFGYVARLNLEGKVKSLVHWRHISDI